MIKSEDVKKVAQHAFERSCAFYEPGGMCSRYLKHGPLFNTVCAENHCSSKEYFLNHVDNELEALRAIPGEPQTPLQ